MRKLLFIAALMLISEELFAAQRISKIEVFWYETSKSPNYTSNFSYDEKGRLARIYDENYGSEHHSDLRFNYDDVRGTITIEELGYADGLRKSITTIVGGKAVQIEMYGDDEDGGTYSATYTLKYNEQNELQGLYYEGQLVQKFTWSNNNITRTDMGEEYAEITSFSDYNTPESFPIFFYPLMEFDAYQMPNPFFHFASLFGKRSNKLPAISTAYEETSAGIERFDFNYSYMLDAVGNIKELTQIAEKGGDSYYDRLVFYYESGSTNIKGNELPKQNDMEYYNLSGQKVERLGRGVHIIKETDRESKVIYKK